ncbi:MAG: hypothetical protein II937_13740 [Bacteroidales bacterium]|nr:hypothetical protein [Bacteroidales bacterium]
MAQIRAYYTDDSVEQYNCKTDDFLKEHGLYGDGLYGWEIKKSKAKIVYQTEYTPSRSCVSLWKAVIKR